MENSAITAEFMGSSGGYSCRHACVHAYSTIGVYITLDGTKIKIPDLREHAAQTKQ